MCRDTQSEVVELTKQVQFLDATNKSQLDHIKNLVMEIEVLQEKLNEPLE